MAYDVYEVTIELENGDWPYMQVGADLYDYHRAVIVGLDFAYQRKGKLVSINKIGVARDEVRATVIHNHRVVLVDPSSGREP